MKQIDKIKNLENLSYFNKDTISQLIDIKPKSLSEDINRWIKQDVLIQLKKGLYVTRASYERLQDKTIYGEFIANKLREPSYISLEYILQKHSILTEAVYSLTSITIKSGRIYDNKLGKFIYRSIKESLFTGYNILEKNGFWVNEATKAKALFDYLYLKLLRIKRINKEILKSLRLNLDSFKKKDFDEFRLYCNLSGIKKFKELAKIITGI